MKIIYLGTNYFASEILLGLLIKNFKINYVITKLDTKSGRGLKLKSSPVKNIACLNKINFLEVNSINDKSVENFLKEIKPDIIIVVEYGEKINNTVISIPQYGIINIHPSLLPLLRGSTPIEHAILNNYKETGVSIIKINDTIDGGTIINVKKCKIVKGETYLSLFNKLKNLAIKSILELLNNASLNINFEIIQDNLKVTYAPKFNKNFYKINWNDDACLINRKIRSTFKKHMARINNLEVNIIDTSVITRFKKNCFEPGSIIKVSDVGLDIITKDYVLRVKKLQISGKKINSVKEILKAKSNIFYVGNKFV